MATETSVTELRRLAELHKGMTPESWNMAWAADEIERLRDALVELEDANDALCAMRTKDQYLEMIDGGQKDVLLRLDEARRVARALVTPNAEVS